VTPDLGLRTGTRVARDFGEIALSAGRLEARAALARRRRGGGALAGIERTEFDPMDPDVRDDPYPAYRRLLAGGPVHHNPRFDVFFLTRHADVRAAARAGDRLSSAEGVVRMRHRLPMMLTRDRPDHTRMRRLLAGEFTRERLGELRPRIEELAHAAIDEMLASPGTDAVTVLAQPLPVALIADLLGVPRSDLPAFRRWSDAVVEGFGSDLGREALRRARRIVGGVAGLRAYVARELASRERHPSGDLIGRLSAAEQAGELTSDEVFWAALMLLVAGNETTTSLLGSLLLAFAEHPGQYELVRRDPALIGAAIDEAMRHQAPIQGMFRSALDDYAVGAATIPAGARVLLLYGAANRDPRRYEDPDRFDVRRAPSDHLAFGSGIHFCLGSHLARLEGQVVLEALIGRVGEIALAGPPRWTRNPSLRGLGSLRLALSPAAAPVR
jgi:cytochrome P450